MGLYLESSNADQPVCIACSATGSGNVSGVHRRQSLQASSEPSLSCGSNADMLRRNHPTALDAYAACSASLYPSLSILLQVLVILAVTTATPERSFSTLKRLKTYTFGRHSPMGDERLTSLALIHVHAQTTPIEPVEVVDKFALTGPHKLNLLG